MTPPLTSRAWLVAGFVSGFISGLTLAAFAAFAEYRLGNPISGTYTFLASVVGGNSAAEGPLAVPLGVFVLFAGTILWAFGYLYAARRQPQLLTRPLMSGAAFGFIVWFVNQAVLAVAGKFTGPTMYTIDRDMVAFVVCFGLPLAFVAARMLPTR